MRKLTQFGVLLSAAAVFMFGCDKSEYETLESGVKYKFIEEGEGPAPQEGQFMILNMQYHLDKNDSLLMDSNDQPFPMAVEYQDSAWQSLNGRVEEALHMLKKGDSAAFLFKANDMFEGRIVPGIDSTDVIRLNIGVEDVMERQAFMDMQQELMKKQREEQMVKMEEQHDQDVETIKSYLSENNIEAEQTESGLFYVTHEEGNGAETEAGKSVTVHYTGTTLQGEKFDSSVDRGKPFSFMLGQGRVIRGWDVGIDLLQVGDSATLYIPSTMAYGPQSRGQVIGENEILVFDIKVIDVDAQ